MTFSSMTSSSVLPAEPPAPAGPPPTTAPPSTPPDPIAFYRERMTALEVEVTQLQAAMAGRAPIEQAKGILMLLVGCSGQVAFDLLTHISGHTHRKVRVVAEAITESASRHARLPDDIRAIIRDACPPAPAAR